MEEHTRQCAAGVGATSEALLNSCVRQIGWLSEQMNALKGDCGATALFALARAVLNSINNSNNGGGVSDAEAFTAATVDMQLARLLSNPTGGQATTGTSSAAASAAPSSASANNSSSVSNSISNSADAVSPGGNVSVGDLWLSLQRYRRAVALTEALNLSLRRSARALQRQHVQVEAKEAALVQTIIRVFSTLAAIGLPVLVDRLTVGVNTNAMRPLGNMFTALPPLGESSPTSDREEDNPEAGSSRRLDALAPLPRLPTPLHSGRVLLASASALRRYKDTSVPPVPTVDHVADAMGVFHVGPLRWVPVHALITQGSTPYTFNARGVLM